MSPSEQEFGELIGEMRALRDGVAEMRRENAEDHAQVVTALGELRTELGTKADNERVANHAKRIDALESGRDEWKGKLAAAAVIGGFVMTFAIGFLLNIIGGGG